MVTESYVCEKWHVLPPDDVEEYWRLFVFEIIPDGSEEILDITHHDSEEAADEYLKTNWGVQNAPTEGVKLLFEFQRSLL